VLLASRDCQKYFYQCISPVTNEWREWGSSPENPIIYNVLLNFLLVPLWQISHFMLFQVLPS
jgi:hypothetical protein